MRYPAVADLALPPDLARVVPDEHACADLLAAVRWPGGFRCSRCGGTRSCRIASRPRVFVCILCKRHHSVTAGTALQSSHLSMGTWIHMAWLLAAWPNTPAVEIALRLDMHYDTAWHVYQKLRAALDDGDPILTGVVEVAPLEVSLATTKTVWKDPETEPPPAPTLVYVTRETKGPGYGRMGFAWEGRPSARLGPDARLATDHHMHAEMATDSLVGRLARVHWGVSYRWLPRYLKYYAYTMEIGVRGPALHDGFLRRLAGAPHVRRTDMTPP